VWVALLPTRGRAPSPSRTLAARRRWLLQKGGRRRTTRASQRREGPLSFPDRGSTTLAGRRSQAGVRRASSLAEVSTPVSAGRSFAESVGEDVGIAGDGEALGGGGSCGTVPSARAGVTTLATAPPSRIVGADGRRGRDGRLATALRRGCAPRGRVKARRLQGHHRFRPELPHIRATQFAVCSGVALGSLQALAQSPRRDAEARAHVR
jgi:hypothetical protein